MMRVKFKRTKTGSVIWVEMKTPDPWVVKNCPLLWFHFENSFVGRGPGPDWYPIGCEELV